MGVADRVLTPDALGREIYLRSTWRADRRLVTMSIWSQNVCLAATTIEPESLPALVTLFANALGDAAQTAFHGDAFDWTPPTRQTAYQRVQGWVRQTGARAARLTRRMVHDNDVESQPTECGLEPLGAARVN